MRINAITLWAVFLLILVGSIVRVMGAGMGCPDWPKCFGEYIPPTSSDGLPKGYQEIFREQRIAKNKRLAGLMHKLGYAHLGDRIINDPNVHKSHEFDVAKAWIEYVNRLIGVIIGFLVFLNMIFSFAFRKKSVFIPAMGVAIFILTGVQGWIGSLVVSTNLLHGFISVHMIVALVIVALLIWMNVRVKELHSYFHKGLFVITLLTILLFIPQLILGTEVRGVIDDLLVSAIGRGSWYESLSSSFYIHRSYSWLILIGCVCLFFYAKKTEEKWLKSTASWLLGFVLLIMIAGIGMAKFSFPFWLQPIHLMLAVGIFSLLFYLILRLRLVR